MFKNIQGNKINIFRIIFCLLINYNLIFSQQISSPKLELSRSISGSIAESDLSGSEYDLLDNLDVQQKGCYAKLKKAGSCLKSLFKKQIFNLLAVENLFQTCCAN